LQPSPTLLAGCRPFDAVASLVGLTMTAFALVAIGVRIADPYRWLEDADSTETKEWSSAQDGLYNQLSADYETHGWFADQVRSLMGAGHVGVPVWRGERRFVSRRAPGQEHAVLLLAESDGTEHTLIDPIALDPEGTTTLDSWAPDPAGRLLAYQLSSGGDEESLLYVTDLDTGAQVDGPIDRCRYSPIAWLPDGSAFFYVRRLAPDQVPDGEEQYHRRVYLHRVGTPTEDDVLIFGDGRDKTEYYGLAVSVDGRWLTLSAAPGTASRNDAWIADLAEADPAAPRFVPVQEEVDAEVAAHVGRDGVLYLFTDRDAPRGRIRTADPRRPGYENWRTLVPEDPEAVLAGFSILDGPELGEAPVLLVIRQRHAVSEITVHDLGEGTPLGSVELPGIGSVGALRSRREGGHEAWFGYTDHTTPSTVYRYDARTGAVEVWAAPPNPPRVPTVRTEQVTYLSADGTPVRMFVLSPANAEGPLPTVLYGYGGFSISLTPGFSATALAWVEAGGRYAVANLRGGLEEGEEWHRAGMLERKQNVFDDVKAAARHLIGTGATTAEQLAIMGGSNGGLLVGAAITQSPELFSAAVCSAPLLDMVRYEHVGLGRLWTPEFGSAEDPEQFQWLHGYSPYHHVHPGTRYPATLFTVFDNDSRVDPMHARKMCAALQEATSAPCGERPILLRRESEVGHSARSVSRSVALSADCLAFLARHTGLVPARVPPSSPRRFVHLAQVRYGDLDPQNHVNNVRMLAFLEDARIGMLHWNDGAPQGTGPMVVARQEAEYLAPLLPRREPVRVEVWVSELRGAAFTLDYEIRDEETVYLRARTVIVGFNAETQRARRLSEAERELLRGYLVEE
jgi:prolyl oligopeptidase